jgi:hypothetical protein
LKKACLAAKRIERDTVVDAEKKSGITQNSITIFIRNSKKKNITFWTDVVKDHFDKIVLQVEEEIATASSSSSKPMASSSSSRLIASSSASIPTENPTVEEGDITTDAHDVEFPINSTRVCSVPLMTMLRPDLADDMRDHIVNVLEHTVVTTSNYLTELG